MSRVLVKVPLLLATASLVLGVSALSAREASAQEIILTGPLKGACAAVFHFNAAPARAEWAYWISTGASLTHRPDRSSWSPNATAGAEVTFEVGRYIGFPWNLRFPYVWVSPNEDRHRGYAGIRVGPWVAAATRDAGALVEGGALIQVDGTHVRKSLGGLGIRVGAGYGSFGDNRAPHATMTFFYGFHSVPGRYKVESFCEPPEVPRKVAEAAFARAFVTHRRALGVGETWEVAFGIEMTPTWLFRPLKKVFGRH